MFGSTFTTTFFFVPPQSISYVRCVVMFVMVTVFDAELVI
jgi:hypothetical protein